MNTNIEILLDRTAEYLLKYDASEEGQKCAHEIQDYYEYRPNYILGCLDYARKFAHKAQTIDIDEDPNEFISVANKAYYAWASSMKTQNENIKKNKIRITESKLKQIVAESVKRVLSETYYNTYIPYFITNQNFHGQNGKHIPGKWCVGTVGGGGAVPASPDFDTPEEAKAYAEEHNMQIPLDK